MMLMSQRFHTPGGAQRAASRADQEHPHWAYRVVRCQPDGKVDVYAWKPDVDYVWRLMKYRRIEKKPAKATG